MPNIFLDGTVKNVSYAKAAEARAYLDDDTPGHQLKNLKPEQRKKVEAYIKQIADIDFSDIPKVTRSTKANKPAVRKVLEDKSLKGKALFTAVKKAWRGQSDTEVMPEVPQGN